MTSARRDQDPAVVRECSENFADFHAAIMHSSPGSAQSDDVRGSLLQRLRVAHVELVAVGLEMTQPVDCDFSRTHRFRPPGDNPPRRICGSRPCGQVSRRCLAAAEAGVRGKRCRLVTNARHESSRQHNDVRDGLDQVAGTIDARDYCIEKLAARTVRKHPAVARLCRDDRPERLPVRCSEKSAGRRLPTPAASRCPPRCPRAPAHGARTAAAGLPCRSRTTPPCGRWCRCRRSCRAPSGRRS